MKKIVNTMSDLVASWAQEVSRTSTPHDDLLQNAIADFQEFCNDFTDYFEGIIANNEYDVTKTTAEHLRYQYVQTLHTYWSAVEQVILQWQVQYYRGMLNDAHLEATRNLQNLNLPLPGLLIYFNKVSSIRYLPFTRIPILGIPHPFSRSNNWSAIPHEIGHYVFWNLAASLPQTQKLQQQLRDDIAKCLTDAGVSERLSQFVLVWLEEVFCDVVGVKVDGQGYIASSEQFLGTQAGNENGLTLNDGHHPPPVIRPYIWYRALQMEGRRITLQKLKKIFNPAILGNFSKFKIKASNPMIIEAGPITASRAVFNDNDFETFKMSEVVFAIETMVDALSEKIDGILPTIHIATRKASAFQELSSIIAEEKRMNAKFKDNEIYEVLLRPQALEEGDQHTHGYNIPFHGWHEVYTHSH